MKGLRTAGIEESHRGKSQRKQKRKSVPSWLSHTSHTKNSYKNAEGGQLSVQDVRWWWKDGRQVWESRVLGDDNVCPRLYREMQTDWVFHPAWTCRGPCILQHWWWAHLCSCPLVSGELFSCNHPLSLALMIVLILLPHWSLSPGNKVAKYIPHLGLSFATVLLGE